MSTKQDVSFGGPSMAQIALAPDYVVQQQQLERHQALINALRQQSLDQIDGGRGAISWTQGLAKLVSALAASKMQKENDARAANIYRGISDRLTSPYGHFTSPPVVQAPSQPQQPAPQSSIPLQSTITPVDPDAALNAPFVPAPPPAAAAQSSQPQQPPSQGGWAPGPMALTGTPQDVTMAIMAPDAYNEEVVKSHAPVPAAQMMQQAQAALARGDTATASAILNQVYHDQYVAPVQARGNSWTIDPRTGQRSYNPSLPEGGEPVYDGNGRVVGVKAIDGSLKLIGDVEGEKAGARAAAEAPYQVEEVYNQQTGQYEKVPRSAITGGRGPRGSTILANGPAVSAPGPSTKAAGSAAGSNSANAFNAAISAGQSAKDSIRQIDNIQTAAKGLVTGQGAGAINEIKSAWNVVAPDWAPHADTGNIAKFDEIKKNAATLGMTLAGAASGSNGTSDARLNNALNALPNANYSPAAIQEVSFNLKGLQAGAYGRAQAAAKWQQQHGPESYPQFQSTWQQAYNPDIFYYRQRGTRAFADWFSRLPKPQQGRVRQQMNTLAQMGAFDE